MNNDFHSMLSEETHCLPKELFGEQVRKVPCSIDSRHRASRVDIYAERLSNGLDIWTGGPVEDACNEAARMLEAGMRPKSGGRQPKTLNGLGKAVQSVA